MEAIRLDKYIADSGEFSRKEAKNLIKNGRVIINGRVASFPEEKVSAGMDRVLVDGSELYHKRFIYIMMNKPAGVISATEDTSEKTVLDLMEEKYKKLGIFPGGRLDKDAEGLLILTNDGDFAHRLMSPKRHVDKCYYVETDGMLYEDDCKKIEQGIVLKDGLVCRPGKLEIISAGDVSRCRVIIHEGKYHQVKRMLASLGKPVKYLKRISIGGLELDKDLGPGQYRELTDVEIIHIFQKKDK